MEWNLRNRLNEAEVQRRLAAGLPPVDGAQTPDPDPGKQPTESEQTASPPIDLRNDASVLSAAGTVGLPVWQGSALQRSSSGRRETAIASRAPTKERCPTCHGKVRLARFDVDNATADMTCTECGYTYAVKSPKL